MGVLGLREVVLKDLEQILVIFELVSQLYIEVLEERLGGLGSFGFVHQTVISNKLK